MGRATAAEEAVPRAGILSFGRSHAQTLAKHHILLQARY